MRVVVSGPVAGESEARPDPRESSTDVPLEPCSVVKGKALYLASKSQYRDDAVHANVIEESTYM